MKHSDASRHPGIMRMMPVDAESAGLLVAAGFVVLALVSLPLAKSFLLATLALGLLVVLLLHFAGKRFEGIGMVFVMGFVVLGLASIPIAKWFLLPTLCLGVIVVAFLRHAHKD
jgi:apolipoprotein N-acyltransferase